MAVDIFDLKKFTSALPVDSSTGEPLFKHLGMEYGEHVFVWVIPNNTNIRIKVRSSIGSSGYSASCGEDSIRIMIECFDTAKQLWVAVGKGPDAYTTRVKGWEIRLKNKIREVFYDKVKKIKRPVTGTLHYVTKDTVNKGRPFQLDAENKFSWLDT